MANSHSILCSSPTIHRSLGLPIIANAPPPILLRSSRQALGLQSSPSSVQGVRADSVAKWFRFSGRKLEFCVRAEDGVEGGAGGVDEKSGLDEHKEFRGVSTWPDRFKLYVKNVLGVLPRWLLFVGFFLYISGPVFLLCAKVVLWELGRWRKAFSNLNQLLVSIIAYEPDKLMSIILDEVRAFYASVLLFCPVSEFITVIMFASAMLAISESASPGSITSQWHLLTVSSLVAFAAVNGYIVELTFWLILIVMFGFAKFTKKRDSVSSSLPVATALASVGEPWIRVLVAGSFTALAIRHHWSKILRGKAKQDEELSEWSWRRVPLPLPLRVIGLVVGMRLAFLLAAHLELAWKIV